MKFHYIVKLYPWNNDSTFPPQVHHQSSHHAPDENAQVYRLEIELPDYYEDAPVIVARPVTKQQEG